MTRFRSYIQRSIEPCTGEDRLADVRSNYRDTAFVSVDRVPNTSVSEIGETHRDSWLIASTGGSD
ncbi:MAG: hypothetical protein DRJ42_18515 [Deltaproteobacteria bacterium]|nr:MAG: hypothetical protein DRJ42_18515 [Deltaproteobacteria bacterium]